MARIMIVEDEKVFASALSHRLKKLGYEVSCIASDGDEAVEMAVVHRPDLILMDIMLEGNTDGIEAARKIKEKIDSPIIFLTAHSKDEYLDRAKDVQPMGYLTKPFPPEDIKAAIEIALHKHKMERELQKSNQALKKAYAELEVRMGEREAIFQSVSDAIITVDNQLRLTGANRAATEICGLNIEKSLGQHLGDARTACEQNCYEVLAETLQNKMPITNYNLECHLENGSARPVVINSSTLAGTDQKQMGAVLVIRDVSRLNDLEQQLLERNHFHNIIGRSRKMLEIYSLIENLAETEANVLLLGESGTGKEVVARALHFSGHRAYNPLVKVNCSALSENLLESELFGHVKGAFTHAVKDRIGRFQAAHGGTILLDEIGEISPFIQLKLLRVLQENEFEPVGDSNTIKVDVRVIATTNANLKNKVLSGQFREDLYYRLKVVQITLPPLRERTEDIPLLIDHFIGAFAKSYNKNITSVSNEALKLLMQYPWPGNVRELEHAIEHAFVVCRTQAIAARDLPPEITRHPTLATASSKSSPGPEQIRQALKKAGWNKSKAARMLGLGRRTIYRKIEQFDIREDS